MFHLLRFTCKMLGGMMAAVGLFFKIARFEHQVERRLRRKKENDVTMKKSVLVAVIAALAAVAGALAAVAVYLHRREKELDEYEKLLFSEEFEDEDAGKPEADAEDEAAAEPAPVREEGPEAE